MSNYDHFSIYSMKARISSDDYVSVYIALR